MVILPPSSSPQMAIGKDFFSKLTNTSGTDVVHAATLDGKESSVVLSGSGDSEYNVSIASVMFPLISSFPPMKPAFHPTFPRPWLCTMLWVWVASVVELGLDNAHVVQLGEAPSRLTALRSRCRCSWETLTCPLSAATTTASPTSSLPWCSRQSLSAILSSAV